MKIDGESGNQQLLYWCKNCGHQQEHDKNDNNCVFHKSYNKGEKNYKNLVNKYTIYDPTLPRVNNIICPNNSCKTNDKQNPDSKEVIYINYDSDNMKYLYVCCKCKTAWKNNSSGNENNVEII
jgi:DNA-directed RNA polymerase subunit RPC12/RpoP